jgi:hypothetical protein
MTELTACMLCAIDPQAAPILLPIAQATLISAPIFLRHRLMELVRRVWKARAKR